MSMIKEKRYYMKYFCSVSEREGTCYYEFKKGADDGSVWSEDSIIIHDDIWKSTGAWRFFMQEIDDFDSCGRTEISCKDWKKIFVSADDYNDSVRDVIYELNDWIEENTDPDGVFTIIGI